MAVDLNKKARTGFNKPLGGGTVVQMGGLDWDVKGLREKAMEEISAGGEMAGCKVNSIDIYVKPAERECYWVARSSGREASGHFAI